MPLSMEKKKVRDSASDARYRERNRDKINARNYERRTLLGPRQRNRLTNAQFRELIERVKAKEFRTERALRLAYQQPSSHFVSRQRRRAIKCGLIASLETWRDCFDSTARRQS